MRNITEKFLEKKVGSISVLLILSTLITIAMLLSTYNTQWYSPDDGAFALFGERILQGEILNLDFHSVHAGYINFLNAALLYIFGNNIASLRIFLVILSIIQSVIMFKLFKPLGLYRSFTAAIVISSLSFVQYSTVAPSWYVLFMLISLIYYLQNVSELTRYRMSVIGFSLMTIFLFRQLSGIIAGIGVVSYILYKEHSDIRFKKSIISKILFLIMFLGLAGYLFMTINISTIILFGACPLLILLIGILRVKVENNRVLIILRDLILGGMVSILPLLIYHLYNGSLTSWYNDTVISALYITDLAPAQSIAYLDYIIYSIRSIVIIGDFRAFFFGFLLISLILASPLLGILQTSILIENSKSKGTIDPLPLIASFFVLVSVFHQITIYLFYSIGLTFCGLLWISKNGNEKTKLFFGYSCALIAVAVYFYNATVPLGQSMINLMTGKGEQNEIVYLGGKVNLSVPKSDKEKYEKIINIVEQNVSADETIFAFPNNSEIYYITDRKNPTRFYNTTIGTYNADELQKLISWINITAPKVIFFNPTDKYVNGGALAIADVVKQNYQKIDQVDEIEVYLLLPQQ